MGDILRVVKQSWNRPEEIWAVATLLHSEKKMRTLRLDECEDDKDIAFCFEILCQVSRSFAGVIKQLDRELRLPVCVFYLVLRALDTIEDDTRIPGEVRAQMCTDFYKNLSKPGWNFDGAGTGADKQLVVEFEKVIRVFAGLKRKYCLIITDITKRMGAGMADFINRSRVDTVEDWNLYCHYVAGLVGLGLSSMFSQSGKEPPAIEADKGLSNEMGLFLQKTNIIRDYLEDINDNRIFWPQDVAHKYAQDLAAFKDPAYLDAGLCCLNDLVTNALELVPSSLAYLRQLQTPDVFRFCAIPQVMAIATLSECYNNPAVFSDVVKIRKGLAAKMIMDCTGMDYVEKIFHRFADDILRRIPATGDPSAAKTTQLCQRIKAMTVKVEPTTPATVVRAVALPVTLLMMCAVYFSSLPRGATAVAGLAAAVQGVVRTPTDAAVACLGGVLCAWLATAVYQLVFGHKG